MDWASRRERYTGQWEDGQPHGHGEHIWLKLQARLTKWLRCSASMLCRPSCLEGWHPHNTQAMGTSCSTNSYVSYAAVT
eukprot:6202268-Pleurochrysis_carterae.AAC.2